MTINIVGQARLRLRSLHSTGGLNFQEAGKGIGGGGGERKGENSAEILKATISPPE